LAIFDDLVAGGGARDTISSLEELNEVIGFGSLCGLGQMAPNPIRALLSHFGEEVREHVNRVCRAGVCW
jgi:NADH:ubiquinone oxidoreductase subunit F (NADH-binding)